MLINLVNKNSSVAVFIASCFLFYSQFVYAVPPVTDITDPNYSSNSSSTTTNTNLDLGNLSVDQRLTRVENILQNQSQLLNQIDSLQQQVQDLRGQVEVLTNSNDQLRQQQLKFYTDLDTRLQALEKTPGAAKLPVSASASTPMAPAVTGSPSTAENDAYQAAYTAIKNKDYPQASKQFQDFIVNYPNSDYIPNAHYWLGEVYLAQSQPEDAKKEFNFLIKQFPQHTKVPDALLKLAFIDYDQGQTDKAIAELKDIQKRYPGTTAASLAKSKLQNISGQ